MKVSRKFKPININSFLKQLDNLALDVAEKRKKDFDELVRTSKWLTAKIDKTTYRYCVWVDDGGMGIWEKIALGTQDHFVKPKSPDGVLAFPANYKRKTVPNAFKSQAGGPSGQLRFSKGHKVKGIEAGNWHILAREKAEAELEIAARTIKCT